MRVVKVHMGGGSTQFGYYIDSNCTDRWINKMRVSI